MVHICIATFSSVTALDLFKEDVFVETKTSILSQNMLFFLCLNLTTAGAWHCDKRNI